MAKSWLVPDFDPEMPLVASLRQVMKTRCLELFSQEEGLRDGSVDAIHNTRITSRRLLVIYDVFKNCVKKKKLKRCKIKIKNLYKLTGKVREYDVQMEFLEKYLDDKTHPASEAVALLYARFKVLRSFEHKKLMLMLDKLDREDFQGKFFQAIDKALM